MASWEYNMVHASKRDTVSHGTMRAPAPALAEVAAVLISEHATNGWTLHAAHHTRAGTHLLFRRPLLAEKQG